jgi:hypothetical protein
LKEHRTAQFLTLQSFTRTPQGKDFSVRRRVVPEVDLVTGFADNPTVLDDDTSDRALSCRCSGFPRPGKRPLIQSAPVYFQTVPPCCSPLHLMPLRQPWLNIVRGHVYPPYDAPGRFPSQTAARLRADNVSRPRSKQHSGADQRRLGHRLDIAA